eukprot:CAMPEP_0168173598 /NCGR_PEP_ID=MMETSP0139_2-20121125/5996_1 /TAXON_ID=44445 /ORGANISM="Pseudo-nitzschia australis, Strain 10249 10 AB" /LENGTH=143 /DNA_ID=CAMNT_0008091573 /DNA_START=1044 /DNA_END=1476 /DNA_ORIENTATION=+
MPLPSFRRQQQAAAKGKGRDATRRDEYNEKDERYGIALLTEVPSTNKQRAIVGMRCVLYRDAGTNHDICRVQCVVGVVPRHNTHTLLAIRCLHGIRNETNSFQPDDKDDGGNHDNENDGADADGEEQDDDNENNNRDGIDGRL